MSEFALCLDCPKQQGYVEERENAADGRCIRECVCGTASDIQERHGGKMSVEIFLPELMNTCFDGYIMIAMALGLFKSKRMLPVLRKPVSIYYSSACHCVSIYGLQPFLS